MRGVWWVWVDVWEREVLRDGATRGEEVDETRDDERRARFGLVWFNGEWFDYMLVVIVIRYIYCFECVVFGV